MKSVWKYELVETDVQRIEMPEGARLLFVAGQSTMNYETGPPAGDRPKLWAEVDTSAPKVRRLIRIVGTGNPAPGLDDAAIYVGSAICGPFVWHVYDGGEVQ